MIFSAKSYTRNENGTITEDSQIQYDIYNAAMARRHVCKAVNKLLKAGKRGEVRVTNDTTGEVLAVVTVS